MRRILYCWATEIYKKKKIQAHCSEELPTTQATGVCPPRRAGRGCIILRMPRRPQSTCMALECTGGITRLSGFLRVHVPKSREASLWGTLGTFSFLEFSRGLEKPGKFHSSYFCLPLPHSPHSGEPQTRKNFPNNRKCPASKCSAGQNRQAPASYSSCPSAGLRQTTQQVASQFRELG